jgi:hypothetical protein
LGRHLTEHLRSISAWAVRKKLKIEPSKLHVTLFAPWTKEVNKHPAVFIDGTLIALKKNPKQLDNTFSPLNKSSAQVNTIIPKLNKGLQLLKATSGQSFGDKETLRLTYQAFMKPVKDNVAPIWYPRLEPDSTIVERIQTNQNSAMRMITGNVKMASQDHLLAESSVLPIKAHLGLICSQFLASASRSSHPSNEVIKIPTGERKR